MSRISGWRCDCGAYNAKADDQCEGCGRSITLTADANAWRRGEARDEKPPLPAYREFPDRRSAFRPCEHVAVGAELACPECEAQIREYRQQFREYGQRIQARNVQL